MTLLSHRSHPERQGERMEEGSARPRILGPDVLPVHGRRGAARRRRRRRHRIPAKRLAHASLAATRHTHYTPLPRFGRPFKHCHLRRGLSEPGAKHPGPGPVDGNFFSKAAVPFI